MLSDYFDNQDFIEKLKGYSPQTKLQLALLNELTKISIALEEESCNL